MLGQTDWLGDGVNAGYDRIVSYNPEGLVDRETIVTRQGDATLRAETSNVYGTGDELLSATTETYRLESGSWRFQGRAQTANAYDWYDGAVTLSSRHDADMLSGSNPIYTNSYAYSGTGELTRVDIDDGRPRTITYTADLAGQIIRRDEADRLSGGDPHEIWYRYNGRQVGYVGNNGTNDRQDRRWKRAQRW